MTNFAISRYDEPDFRHTVMKKTYLGESALDLRLNGTKLWFVAKKKASDAYADALIVKTYEKTSGGAVVSNGIAVDLTNPGNIATTTLTSTDTAELTRSATLSWALVVEEPDGRRFTAESGLLDVRVAAGNPP